MVTCHYVERIWRILVTLNFLCNIYDHEENYPDELFNKHIKELINIIQENNKVITVKEGKGKFPLFVVIENG